jgi:hypothetical protein
VGNEIGMAAATRQLLRCRAGANAIREAIEKGKKMFKNFKIQAKK